MKFALTSLWKKRTGDRATSVQVPARNAPLSLGPPHAQSQSLMFSKLPTEIRLRIYSFALVGPSRFLHILHEIPDRCELDRLGHWRCDDEENPHMIWQHGCFGQWSVLNEPETPRVSNTNSESLSLLRSCRSTYVEAREILYSQNTFSFRGCRGVTLFNKYLSCQNWQLVRHIHISTIFRTPWQLYLNCFFTPENYNDWKEACAVLQTLTNLESLGIEMVIWNQARHHDSSPADHDSLMIIFGALMGIKSAKFEIELNIDLPESIRKKLGKTPFSVRFQERPHDGRTFIVGG